MRYSISDLEQLSGVQTHTIRIWERRYQALEPMRSAGNTRFYDDNQLRRLLNIVSLNQTGLKISHVCALSELEMKNLLEKELEQVPLPLPPYEYYVSQLLSYGLSYEEVPFDTLITQAIAEYGLKDTYLHVIYPLLFRLGLMWRSDNICPAQEHFLSNIIRQKICSATDEIKQNPMAKSTWVLFLPEDEDHDVGLLLANYLLRLSGQKVIYLGAKVPIASVDDVINRVGVDHLLTFMVRSRPMSGAQEYLEALTAAFPGKAIHVAGSSRVLADTRMGENMDWMKSISDLEEIIKNIEDVQ